MLIEMALSALGGASVALAMTAFLAKSFLKIQFEKVLARHSHALSVEKEQLGHDLAVELHQKNLRNARVESDRVDALKALYCLTVELSSALIAMRKYANISPAQNFSAAYFNGLKDIFNELSSTFSKISDGYVVLDKQAIYIDDVTERSIKGMLDNILSYYNQALAECKKILAEAQAIQPILTENNQPKSLKDLCSEMSFNWQSIVSPSSIKLKEEIRQLLRA